MKIGIYISGLGISKSNSVESYAERLKNEINFNTNGYQYETKIEKIHYSKSRESTVVSIVEKESPENPVYKFYDFKYNEILTEDFKGRTLIYKSLWLFALVIRKFPLIIKRIFIPQNYSRPGQLMYVFSIFLILSLSLVLMFPAVLEATGQFFSKESGKMTELRKLIPVGDLKYISMKGIFIDFPNGCSFNIDFHWLSRMIVLFTALLVLLVPNANTIITDLATNFVCANDYLQHGSKKQMIQGNLEHLVDYITENEKGCKIHFHAYSFGSVLALDYVFPYGVKASKNALQYCEAIITIGTPYEFVNSYYPEFYNNRQTQPGDQLQWLNVYSAADALGSNFRKDGIAGDSEISFKGASNKPFNINYEVYPVGKFSIIDFIMLYSIKVHDMYWDENTEGQSCLGLVYQEMKGKGLI